jgi:enterochelin esterase-like enzyme
MNEIVETLASLHLQNERSIWVRPPRVGSSAKNLTVFLDAELYRDRVDAVSVIDRLNSDVADSWYVLVSVGSVEARWLECPCHPPFARMIVDELLPWLESRHEGMSAARQRTLVGLSYTGLAAAFVAMVRPGAFQRVISQSGSFWWNDCWLVKRFQSVSRLPTEFYLEVGTKEVQENIRHREDVLQVVSQIEGVRRFRNVLRLTGHTMHYSEFEGAHSFESWKQTLPRALQWALQKERNRR